MTTVYRKSAKGQHEIETRANRLGPRLRTALILIDGRRSDVDLRALIQAEPDATLLALLEAGYVEVVSVQGASPQTVVPSSAAAGAPASAAPSAPAAPTLPAAAPAAAMSPAALAERRRLAVRHLTDQIGPAAETAAMRIEKARNWDELRQALEHGQRVLQAARGGAAATQFAARFLDLPPA
jgi:hypothetical protein